MVACISLASRGEVLKHCSRMGLGLYSRAETTMGAASRCAREPQHQRPDRLRHGNCGPNCPGLAQALSSDSAAGTCRP